MYTNLTCRRTSVDVLFGSAVHGAIAKMKSETKKVIFYWIGIINAFLANIVICSLSYAAKVWIN